MSDQPKSPPKDKPALEVSKHSRSKAGLIAWAVTAGLILMILVVVMLVLHRFQIDVKITRKKPLEAPAKKLANVETITLKTEPYRESLTLPARLIADQEADISSELAGTLAKWLVPEGGKVIKGQGIARLDTAALDAQLVQLQAQKTATESGVQVANANLELAKVGIERAGKEKQAAELQLKAAQSALALAEKQYDRTSSLVTKKVSPESELEAAADRLTQSKLGVAGAREGVAIASTGISSAKVQVTQAQANVKLSEAQVSQLAAAIKVLRVSLGKAEVKAPFSGRLDQHLVEAGEVVNPGQVLARLYDLSYVRAVANVGDRFVPFLKQQEGALKQYLEFSLPGAKQDVAVKLIIPGMPRLDGGYGPDVPLPADLAFIAQAADPASNTFRVELRLKNPDGALKHGIIVRAKIDYLIYPDALVIPLTAVLVTDIGPRCLVVKDDGDRRIVQVRKISPRSIDLDRVLVTGDIEAGEKLIVSGGKGVLDGEEVRVLKSDGVFVEQKVADDQRK